MIKGILFGVAAFFIILWLVVCWAIDSYIESRGDELHEARQ